MCRNHRGFVDAAVACSRLGAHALYLNTMFPRRSSPTSSSARARAIVYDAEFAALVDHAKSVEPVSSLGTTAAPRPRPAARGPDRRGDSAGVPPDEPGRVVILTSGTTGTPKGARRSSPVLDAAARCCRRSRSERADDDDRGAAVPLVGLAHYTLGVPLSSTFVLRRRFDPGGTLRVAPARAPRSSSCR